MKKLCKALEWRSAYEEFRWYRDLSPEDSEWLNSFLDSIQCFLKHTEEAQTHFQKHSGEKIFSDDFLLTMMQVREMENFLKSKLAHNVLFTKEDELDSRNKPALLTTVPLTNIKKEDLECFVCKETLGERNEDGDSEEAVETPCHHTFGSSCASRWFIQDKHEHCPFCRTRLPRYEYEYLDDKKETPEWLALLSIDRTPDAESFLRDVRNIPGVVDIEWPIE